MTSYKHSNVVELRGQSRETREQVLERLFHEHGSHLRAFLKARMGSSDDLEDIVQDVFIRLAKMENLQQRLPISGDSNRSFLFAVANNLVVDMERQQQVRRKYLQRQQEQVDDNSVLSEPTTESKAFASREMDKLKSILMTMKPAWRDAFILNRFMNKSYRETAIEMGVTIKQVERFMKSALTRIQKASIEIASDRAKKERSR